MIEQTIAAFLLLILGRVGIIALYKDVHSSSMQECLFKIAKNGE